jgi:hypothetical protein
MYAVKQNCLESICLLQKKSTVTFEPETVKLEYQRTTNHRRKNKYPIYRTSSHSTAAKTIQWQ